METEPTRVLMATRSAGKLRELEGILAECGLMGVTLDSVGLDPTPDEDGIECFLTFEENALAKARYFHRMSGLPTVADDSGLCVNALNGAPGVFSKRYSWREGLSGQDLDDANNAKLLTELADVSDRSASYACAAAFAAAGVELVTMGYVHGTIERGARGSGGFGYDPYFFCTELRQTFGEAGLAEKARVSHRARAFRALVDALSQRTTAS